MRQSSREWSREHAQSVSRTGDALLIALASAVAAMGGGIFHWKLAVVTFVVATALWLFVGRAISQYSAANGRGFYGDVALTLVMFTAVVVPVSILVLLLPHHGGPLHPVHALAALLPGGLLWRLIAVDLGLWRTRRGSDVLIVGIGPLGRLTGAEIEVDRSRRRLLGYLRFDDEAPHARLPAPVLGTLGLLEETLRRLVVDEVYFASTTNGHVADVQAAIRACEMFGVPFALPTCPYRLARAKLVSGGAMADGYAHFQNVHPRPLQSFAKRLFDIAASGVALLALSPLLVATAALVKLTSRGPVLFRQERVGMHGRTFHMLKFRSMVVNAEELRAGLLARNEQSGPAFKIKHDPRVTAFGRFMRKHSVDELPQLVNVLRGEMSLVGPRPPIPA
ncbi:MAG: sugar transferase, partial [Polyangiaceae bacterium]